MAPNDTLGRQQRRLPPPLPEHSRGPDLRLSRWMRTVDAAVVEDACSLAQRQHAARAAREFEVQQAVAKIDAEAAMLETAGGDARQSRADAVLLRMGAHRASSQFDRASRIADGAPSSMEQRRRMFLSLAASAAAADGTAPEPTPRKGGGKMVLRKQSSILLQMAGPGASGGQRPLDYGFADFHTASRTVMANSVQRAEGRQRSPRAAQHRQHAPRAHAQHSLLVSTHQHAGPPSELERLLQRERNGWNPSTPHAQRSRYHAAAPYSSRTQRGRDGGAGLARHTPARATASARCRRPPTKWDVSTTGGAIGAGAIYTDAVGCAPPHLSVSAGCNGGASRAVGPTAPLSRGSGSPSLLSDADTDEGSLLISFTGDAACAAAEGPPKSPARAVHSPNGADSSIAKSGDSSRACSCGDSARAHSPSTERGSPRTIVSRPCSPNGAGHYAPSPLVRGRSARSNWPAPSESPREAHIRLGDGVDGAVSLATTLTAAEPPARRDDTIGAAATTATTTTTSGSSRTHHAREPPRDHGGALRSRDQTRKQMRLHCECGRRAQLSTRCHRPTAAEAASTLTEAVLARHSSLSCAEAASPALRERADLELATLSLHEYIASLDADHEARQAYEHERQTSVGGSGAGGATEGAVPRALPTPPRLAWRPAPAPSAASAAEQSWARGVMKVLRSQDSSAAERLTALIQESRARDVSLKFSPRLREAAEVFDQKQVARRDVVKGALKHLQDDPSSLSKMRAFVQVLDQLKRVRLVPPDEPLRVELARAPTQSAASSDGRRGGVKGWCLEESSFRLRPTGNDSRDFYDTAATLSAAFNTAWSIALRSHRLAQVIVKHDDGDSDDGDGVAAVDEDGDGFADDEVVEVGNVLWRHHALIKGIFVSYAVHTSAYTRLRAHARCPHMCRLRVPCSRSMSPWRTLARRTLAGRTRAAPHAFGHHHTPHFVLRLLCTCACLERSPSHPLACVCTRAARRGHTHTHTHTHAHTLRTGMQLSLRPVRVPSTSITSKRQRTVG